MSNIFGNSVWALEFSRALKGLCLLRLAYDISINQGLYIVTVVFSPKAQANEIYHNMKKKIVSLLETKIS